MKGIFLLIFALLCPSIRSQSPGSVPISEWLTTNAENNFSLCTDPTSIPLSASYPSTGFLNYNPALLFDGSQENILWPLRPLDFMHATVFVVYHSKESVGEQSVCKFVGDTDSVSLTTLARQDHSNTYSFDRDASSATIYTYIRHWGDKSTGNGNPTVLFLGQHENTFALFKGAIAELLIYERVLKILEQEKIESHLALKYGITLKHDYISSSGDIIWSYDQNLQYNHRIIGIGRDDAGALFQKQSQVQDLLAIGAGVIAVTNKENCTNISDQDFLILGDDNGALSFDTVRENKSLTLLERRWRMNVFGQTSNTLPTELQLDISNMLPRPPTVDKFMLVIDRSGEGDFDPGNVAYVPAAELTSDGVLTFQNVHWDTDCSGSDIFSFGLEQEVAHQDVDLEGSILLYPNPSTSGYYNLLLSFDAQTPVQVNIYDASGRCIETFSGQGQTHYTFKSRTTDGTGVYTFRIETPFYHTARKLVIQ